MMNISSNSNAMFALVSKRFFTKSTRPWQDRLKPELKRYEQRRLKLAHRFAGKPDQFIRPQYEPAPAIKTVERKLPSLSESRLPYKQYSKEEIDRIQNFGAYNDPEFNPHLDDERYRVDPNEEPFNAIYADNESAEAAAAVDQYTSVRNITSPELWKHVENLAPITKHPEIRRRKPGEPIQPLPSGWIPPAEQPPDLPYFVARTRNLLLPVYYKLHSDPNECRTTIKQITGNLWKLEEDLRIHLEGLIGNKRRILSSVQEADGRIEFRGRYLIQVANWLHQQGF